MRRDGALVLRGDTRHVPLADESVDLIVTSPPYFAQRSYKDGDEHYDGQIGDEDHPQQWLEQLWLAAEDWWRVLKPTGSAFVNFGDKRSGSGAPGTTSGLSGLQGTPQQARTGQVQGDRSGLSGSYTMAAFGRAKSKQLLPHRYAIGMMDGVSGGNEWIVRQDEVWWKRNGMPESVKDRTRDCHEYIFHLTKDGTYYTAMDELREPLAEGTAERYAQGYGDRSKLNDERSCGFDLGGDDWEVNPLGKMPPSVLHWSTEPLIIPDWLGVDHFAAFPTELPRWCIIGWSPPAICLECGEGRRPAVRVEQELDSEATTTGRQRTTDVSDLSGNGWNGEGYPKTAARAQIIGYVCSCCPYTDVPRPARSQGANNKDPRHAKWDGAEPGQRMSYDRVWHLEQWTPPPSRPAVVLDPFGGTGTTAMVARALGRHGISLDLSWDYSRVAKWRVWESGHATKAIERTNRERQGSLL